MADRLIALIIGTDKTPEEFRRLLSAPDLLALQLGQADDPPPAPQPPPKRLGKPVCSNQAVINLMRQLAIKMNYPTSGPWWDIVVVRVGLDDYVTGARNALYSGPAFDDLDWTPRERTHLEDLLQSVTVQ